MALAKMVIERLKMAGMMIDQPKLDGRAPFWSMDEQQHAMECMSEAAFTKFITPFFNEVLAEFGMVFISSKSNPWLLQGTLAGTSTKLKPDGFTAHHGMYQKKAELLYGF